MKANRPQIESALRTPEAMRLFLLHGPDEGGSRGLLKLLAAAMGEGAERIDLSGAELKADPARLADEAAAISMFGDRRWILVEQAGEEIVPAVEALLAAPAAGNPVAIVAGALKGGSRLLKLAIAAPSAAAHGSYPPEGAKAGALVAELAWPLGLDVRGDVAQRIADSAGGNRAVIEQELGKYALYLDAGPGASRALDHDAVEAVGADAEEGDVAALVDTLMGGDAAGAEAALARLRAEGKEGVTLIRAMLRRMTLLARLRAEVEQGKSPGAVMTSSGNALFFKEKDAIGRQLGRWRAELIAKAVSRLAEAERMVMMPGGPGPIAAEAELFAICRQAARLR